MITRGKKKGKTVSISQWCNDWFSTIDGRIFSPSSLAFTSADLKTIREHNNNGELFNYFELQVTKAYFGEFIYTFKKRKL